MIHKFGVLILCLFIAVVTTQASAQVSTPASEQTSTSVSASASSQNG